MAGLQLLRPHRIDDQPGAYVPQHLLVLQMVVQGPEFLVPPLEGDPLTGGDLRGKCNAGGEQEAQNNNKNPNIKPTPGLYIWAPNQGVQGALYLGGFATNTTEPSHSYFHGDATQLCTRHVQSMPLINWPPT